jgi:protoporphyrinogen/coproporphyrinogen III oxidase
MRSQLPAHPLVTLLGQCFGTTRCHRAENCLQTASRSSRSLHSNFLSRRCQVPPHIERSRRQFQTYRRSSADHGLPQAASADIDLTEVYTFRSGQQNSTGGDRQRQTREMQIAVLGGGITGLSNAYYLTRELPDAKITLYEADDRLGGWVRSKQVNIGNGNIVFEQGPRTLRYAMPAGLVVSDIVG